MALNAEDFPVTRDMVYGWVQTWKIMPESKLPIEDYIRQQLDSIDPELADTPLDVSERTDYKGNEVAFIQSILDDLESYA